MSEFTGERVVPGQVDVDLWNEHLARYLFASRLAVRKRVLDIACGTGYGSAELAKVAASVTGVDFSPAAVTAAREAYTAPNLTFLEADARALPLPDASFDLITAFEVIEHLDNWAALLAEAHRLLAPGGQFVVSTPNKAYYAESRADAGPNPFHVHEFEFHEFDAALRAVFPHVTHWTQNHAGAVAFLPVTPLSASELRITRNAPDPTTSHFFLSVCAAAPQLGAPAFVYLPASTNVLREREHHIARLQSELTQKDAWLRKALDDHHELTQLHDSQTRDLESRNRWAEHLNQELASANARIHDLQNEVTHEQATARDTAAAYEAKLADLHQDLEQRTAWVHETETRLNAEVAKLHAHIAEANTNLAQADATIDERTQWAQSLQAQVDALEARLAGYLGSRWVRLGRSVGLGPKS